jgi:serine/threonine protein kinase
VEIMKRLSHPGIITMHDVFEDKQNLYIVMGSQPFIAAIHYFVVISLNHAS